jgi:hypothetical protein
LPPPASFSASADEAESSLEISDNDESIGSSLSPITAAFSPSTDFNAIAFSWFLETRTREELETELKSHATGCLKSKQSVQPALEHIITKGRKKERKKKAWFFDGDAAFQESSYLHTRYFGLFHFT